MLKTAQQSFISHHIYFSLQRSLSNLYLKGVTAHNMILLVSNTKKTAYFPFCPHNQRFSHVRFVCDVHLDTRLSTKLTGLHSICSSILNSLYVT